MDPLSVTASIITVVDLTATVISFLNRIKDAGKERARCAIEASNVFNLLTNLRYRLEEATPEDPWFTAVRTLGTENGPLDQFKATLEQLIAKFTPVNGFKKVGKAIVWKLDKVEVNDIILRIERFKSLIQIALEMDHFKLSQAIKGDVTELREGFKRIEHREADSYHRTIADWLTPVDFAKQQTDFISRRQEGTGLWFLQSAEFTTWLNGVKQTLFCPGIPGAGKTTMASIVIDHLWTTFKDGNTGIAFLYCNYKRQEEQKAVDLLAALLKQLIQDKPSMPQPVKDLYECHVHRRTRPSFEDIAQVLRSVVSDYTRVYVVVDALDECLDVRGTRTAILSELHTLQAQADVKFLATSRFNSNISREFKGSTFLEVRASDEDVERYIENHISRLSRRVQDNPHLQRAITEAITRAVDGMFLLAQLHLDSLTDKKTIKAIKSALATMPKGSEALDGAYKEAVERIGSQSRGDRDLAHNVISWLVNAQRPLTTTELQHALAIEPGEHEFDDDNLPVVEEMVSVCLGLVTVDDESNIIRLVHYTTQDYFESLQVEWIASAPANIALMCITYLSFDVFAIDYCPNLGLYQDTKVGLVDNKFLGYAASHWADHARKAQEEVKDVALNFLQNEMLVENVNRVMDVCQRENPFRFLGRRGMHLAADSDLQVPTKCLLEDGAFPDTLDAEGQTPLVYASHRGHEKIVEQLLNHNADMSVRDTHGNTPLHVAASKGYEKVVKQLLNHNANANLKNAYGDTPLYIAAQNQHEKIVKQLLDYNADVDLMVFYGETPLYIAAQKGYEKIVKQLLNYNADANLKVAYGNTPLSIAAQRGHETIVKQLLDHSADANLKNAYETTPLYIAARRGHEKIVKQLLNHNADANLKCHGKTPLHIAAWEGDEKIVKQLLDHKADANRTNRYGEAPLHTAVWAGHEEIVELLLNQKTDVNLRDKWGQTALHNTTEGDEHHAIVKLLLNHNPDANLVDGNGQTALQIARQNGLKGTAKLLELYTLEPSYPTSLPPRPHESELDDLSTVSN